MSFGEHMYVCRVVESVYDSSKLDAITFSTIDIIILGASVNNVEQIISMA